MEINYQDLFKTEWLFTRSLTLDLLNSLTDAELAYSPGGNLGELWKQFRHAGAIQECYMEALNTGVMRFESRDKHYTSGASKDALVEYLQSLDLGLLGSLAVVEWEQMIRWGGEDSPTIQQHLTRLINHESLHQGEWIVYMRLLGKPFPPSWGVWNV